MWVAIASIRGGDRQSYGSRPSSFNLPRIPAHPAGINATFNRRRHEGSKFRRRPAGLLEQLRMNEIESVEGVFGVFNPAIHMNAARLAGVALDHRVRVHDREFVPVRQHLHIVARDGGHHRQDRSCRLPALGAAADMVVGDLSLYRDRYRCVCAFAHQRAAGKIRCAGLHALIDRWVNENHVSHFVLPALLWLSLFASFGGLGCGSIAGGLAVMLKPRVTKPILRQRRPAGNQYGGQSMQPCRADDAGQHGKHRCNAGPQAYAGLRRHASLRPYASLRPNAGLQLYEHIGIARSRASVHIDP